MQKLKNMNRLFVFITRKDAGLLHPKPSPNALPMGIGPSSTVIEASHPHVIGTAFAAYQSQSQQYHLTGSTAAAAPAVAVASCAFSDAAKLTSVREQGYSVNRTGSSSFYLLIVTSRSTILVSCTILVSVP